MAKTDWRNRIVGNGNVDPETLIANPQNARIHPKNQRDALKGAIGDLGFLRSVTITKDGTVIDGHLRVALALSEGQKTIPVEIVDLDEAETKEALLTLDPIAALAANDKEKLDALLHEVQSGDAAVQQMLADMAKNAGLDYGAEPVDAEPQVDRAAELQAKWQTSTGQLWQLGGHRLLCGDSTKAEDVARVLKDDKPRLWIFDPPFDVPYSQFTLLPSVDVCAVWFRAKEALMWMCDIFADESWGMHTLVFTGGVRGQHNHTLPCCMHENVTVWRRHWWDDKLEAIDRELIRSCGCEKTSDDRPISWQQHTGGVVSAQSTGMSWAKPVVESAIPMAYVPHGSIVWDCCAGSGSSLIAAQRYGRMWRGCEMQPPWVALILDRFQREFSIEPVLLSGAAGYISDSRTPPEDKAEGHA